jgi:hypothetical protein
MSFADIAGPMEGKAMYRKLRSYLVGPELRTLPHTQFAIVAEGDHLGLGRGANTHEPGSTPPATASAGASSKLLRAYLAIGARICGLPAIDREFGTIDFLALLDLHALPAIVRANFLR